MLQNVPDIVEHVLPIRFTLVEGDTDAEVRRQTMLTVGANS